MRTDPTGIRVFRALLAISTLALALITSGASMAQVVPHVVKIQGFLTDRSGPSPVPANGSFSMLFEVFDAEFGGAMEASVGPLTVDVTEGLYEAEIPIQPDVFDGTPRYLQVTVNGEMLAPRLAMVSVPYAFRAGRAAAAATVDPGSVDGTALADDAVTEEKIGVVCPNVGDVLVWNGTGWACAPAPATGVCPAGAFVSCYSGSTGTLGVGECQSGLSYCNASGSGFDPCQGEVLPSAESCDGLDNDCDGATDEDGVCAVCSDGQTRPCGSSVGACQEGIETCAGGAWGACTGDVGPTPEVCDGVDNDCDGTTDEDGVCAACSDGQTRPCGSSVGACQEGIETCAGGAWGACTGDVGPTPESCDDLDNDCDGSTDEGNPGGGGGCSTGLPGVCAAGTTTCSGGVLTCQANQSPTSETCDGLDNDCDGSTDEGNPGGGGSCSTGLQGVCDPGTTTCAGGSLTCQANQSPTSETCDGLDNDCDGSIDEGNPGGGGSCSTGLLGVCASGTTTCSGGSLTCQPDQSPGTEVCDGLDNDCDGSTDEGGVC